jgi:glycosyltransferase involved in cell wall biosynthesis
MQAKLSVITINYNNKDGLQKTIDSVLSQTFAGFEYIIIDGGSTDGSADLLKNGDHRFGYRVSEPDKGIYNAMNKGIANAQGEYLLFLNSGDCLVNNGILSAIFSTERTADIVYGDINYVLQNGEKKRYPSLKEEELCMRNFFTNERATISHPAAFIKRHLFSGELYDESYAIVADNKFFMKQVVINNCSVDYTGLVIADFDTGGLSSKPANWEKTIRERQRIFAELLPPRILKDYELLLQFADSPLLKYMGVLNKTTGFHKLVAGMAGMMTRLYVLVRPGAGVK